MISSSIKRCIIFDIDFARHILKRYVDDRFDFPYPLAISNIQKDLFACDNHCEIIVHCEEPRGSNLLIPNNFCSSFSISETHSLKFDHNLNLVNHLISPFAEEFVKKEGL